MASLHSACKYHDSRSAVKRRVSKGFTLEEDRLIFELRDNTTPSTPWIEIARRMGNHRIPPAARCRYNYLVPDRALRTTALDPRCWTTIQMAELQKLVKSGLRIPDIALKLGKTEPAIRAKIYVVRRGLYSMDPIKSQTLRRSCSEEDVAELRSLRSDGCSLKDIATHMGMTITAVYQKWGHLQLEARRRVETHASETHSSNGIAHATNARG